MEGHPRERSALGWEAGAPLPHPFVSTEKQRSRDLPGLPNLEPGEGEMGGWGSGVGRSREAVGLGQEGNRVCAWGKLRRTGSKQTGQSSLVLTGSWRSPVWDWPEAWLWAQLARPGLMAAGYSSPPGCYFDGDRSWRAAGTRWHPVVPPFGLIKCAVCTCKVWLHNLLWYRNPVGSADTGGGCLESKTVFDEEASGWYCDKRSLGV